MSKNEAAAILGFAALACFWLMGILHAFGVA